MFENFKFKPFKDYSSDKREHNFYPPEEYSCANLLAVEAQGDDTYYVFQPFLLGMFSFDSDQWLFERTATSKHFLHGIPLPGPSLAGHKVSWTSVECIAKIQRIHIWFL